MKNRPIELIIKQNKKTGNWYVTMKAANGEKLFDPYTTKAKAIKTCKMVQTSTFEIVVK